MRNLTKTLTTLIAVLILNSCEVVSSIEQEKPVETLNSINTRSTAAMSAAITWDFSGTTGTEFTIPTGALIYGGWQDETTYPKADLKGWNYSVSSSYKSGPRAVGDGFVIEAQSGYYPGGACGINKDLTDAEIVNSANIKYLEFKKNNSLAEWARVEVIYSDDQKLIIDNIMSNNEGATGIYKNTELSNSTVQNAVVWEPQNQTLTIDIMTLTSNTSSITNISFAEDINLGLIQPSVPPLVWSQGGYTSVSLYKNDYFTNGKPFRLKNRYNGRYLHVQSNNNTLEAGSVPAGYWSSHWYLEQTNPGYYRVKNRWTGGYLNIQDLDGSVQVNSIPAGHWSSHWAINMINNYLQFENRWQDNNVIHNQDGGNTPNYGNVMGYWSSHWIIEAI